MINKKIIKLAMSNKNYGLKNIFTHKTTLKNRQCGDFIKIEIVAKSNTITKMRYETESCIYCQASANILSNKISLFKIDKLDYDISLIQFFFKKKDINLPKKYKDFKELMNIKNINRLNCIILPFNALKKALES